MADNAPVLKAVVPAAGLGTRFLPATKATPKEMLPVVDKPAIQYVVEEAVDAGLHDVLMVTGRSKRSIEDHFDRAYELEEALRAKRDADAPFAVLLGDDMIDARDKLLQRMIEVRNRYGGSVVALMEVEPDQVSAYGCAAIEATDEDDVVRISDLVEKPSPDEAPSNW